MAEIIDGTTAEYWQHKFEVAEKESKFWRKELENFIAKNGSSPALEIASARAEQWETIARELYKDCIDAGMGSSTSLGMHFYEKAIGA